VSCSSDGFQVTSSAYSVGSLVLGDSPTFVVLHHLDELRVAQAIRARPEARLVLVQNGSRVTLEDVTGE
jgi:hypothetical protein